MNECEALYRWQQSDSQGLLTGVDLINRVKLTKRLIHGGNAKRLFSQADIKRAVVRSVTL